MARMFTCADDIVDAALRIGTLRLAAFRIAWEMGFEITYLDFCDLWEERSKCQSQKTN